MRKAKNKPTVRDQVTQAIVAARSFYNEEAKSGLLDIVQCPDVSDFAKFLDATQAVAENIYLLECGAATRSKKARLDQGLRNLGNWFAARRVYWLKWTDRSNVAYARRLRFLGIRATPAPIPPSRPLSTVAADSSQAAQRNVRRRHRRSPLRTDPLSSVKELARSIKGEGAGHADVCRRLGNMDRPTGAAWAQLSWPEAYRKFPRAVSKWLSKHCKP
jgi:hypothetical protein